ncbi:MAG: recG [Rickettsiales bacterium]|jgi:ATP-dependent DNA helicase RecG|nr:recG [Rickettsiales bacterium]
MRSPALFPLFTDINVLHGVGEKNRALLAKLAGPRVIDLLFHLPVGTIDRRPMESIHLVRSGDILTCIVTVEKHFPTNAYSRKKAPYKVRCTHEDGIIDVSFFHAHADYIKQYLPEGQMRVLSGRIERYGHGITMSHPDYITPIDKLDDIAKLEPVYPLTAGISQKQLGKIMERAILQLPTLPEWQDPLYHKKQQWMSWKEALLQLHHPEVATDIALQSPARKRLAYDELFASQLALQLSRQHIIQKTGRRTKGNGQLQTALRAQLGFTLTQGQESVIKEILFDMASENRMFRLLQGDVGSGKTVVALISMLNAVEAGRQAALMAPTEILARQHMQWIDHMLLPLGIRARLLTGKTPTDERQETLELLKRGDVHILIGTHALFQEEVDFQDLSLVIIDEQHRFGVEQRTKLSEKGEAVDILLMTATPIPRTLTMASYGDMDSSRLTDKPASRKPIDTRTIPLSRMEEVIEGLRRPLEKREKIYWICPLVEESEKSDLAAAEDRFADFQARFGSRVGLVHGRIKTEERNKTMLAFRDGEIDILVATTVVEVGVDVPAATIIVIEHAERFGLAQLHQLRGRVGRGEKPSSCILLYTHPLGEIGKARLSTMRESNDGFLIAEEDLRLRGSGDLLGTRQSGLPSFKIADIFEHQALLEAASDDAKLILHNDPQLKTPRGEACKMLLHLFGYDQAMRYKNGG